MYAYYLVLSRSTLSHVLNRGSPRCTCVYAFVLLPKTWCESARYVPIYISVYWCVHTHSIHKKQQNTTQRSSMRDALRACACACVFNTHTYTHTYVVIRHTIEIWLILPVVICLFQGLSHACLRITAFAGICAWLITSDVICRKNLAVSAKLDNLAKRQANT